MEDLSDKRPFVVGADAIRVAALDNGDVGVALIGLGQKLQLAGDLEVVLALSPDEALHLASVLADKAREAGAGSTPPQSH